MGDLVSTPDPPTSEAPSWRHRFARLSRLAWGFIGIAAAVWVLLWLFEYLRVIVVPILLATFLASLGTPGAQRLKERGWPPLLATWLVLLVGAATLGLFGWFLVAQIAGATDELVESVQDAWGSLQGWLASSPFGIDGERIQEFLSGLTGDGGGGGILQRLAAGAGTVTEVIAGFFLTIIIAFFMIKDGDRFWEWLLSKVPEGRRDSARIAGVTAWSTLRRYLAGTAIIGVADAVLIGIALLVLGVPLAVPLALLMFAGAFFPFVGALVSGALVAMVTLATNGVVDALIIAAVVVGVQQVEGDVLAPVVHGQVVTLHPLVVIVSITVGLIVLGLVGAFLAVPVVGMTAQILRKLRPAWLETG